MRARDIEQATQLRRRGERDGVNTAMRHLVDGGEDVGVGSACVVDIGRHGIGLCTARGDRAEQRAVILVGIELDADATAFEVEPS